MEPNKQGIRLLFYLPNIRSYKDRVLMLNEVAKCVEKATLIVSRKDQDEEELGEDFQLEIYEVPCSHMMNLLPLRVSNFVKILIKKDSYNVVHDTFGHLFPLLIKRRSYKSCIFVTSQYQLAEWDWKNVLLPQYGLVKSLTNVNLRHYLYRIFLQRLAFTHAEHIVLQAPGLITRLEKYMPDCVKKSVFIPNSTSYFIKSDASSDVSDRRISEIRLLCGSGALSFGKGGDELLSLIREVKRREINISVVILGGIAPLDRRYFHEQIHQSNINSNIRMVGRVSHEEMLKYYKNSDWLFNFTALDGSPRTALEAIACGLPVIGSSHPGVEIIDPEKQFILFMDGQVEQVIDEMVACKKDPRRYERRVAIGVSYVRDNFSSLSVSNQYVNFYHSILNRK